jgi:hypothetical protein
MSSSSTLSKSIVRQSLHMKSSLVDPLSLFLLCVNSCFSSSSSLFALDGYVVICSEESRVAAVREIEAGTIMFDSWLDC